MRITFTMSAQQVAAFAASFTNGLQARAEFDPTLVWWSDHDSTARAMTVAGQVERTLDHGFGSWLGVRPSQIVTAIWRSPTSGARLAVRRRQDGDFVAILYEPEGLGRASSYRQAAVNMGLLPLATAVLQVVSGGIRADLRNEPRVNRIFTKRPRPRRRRPVIAA